MNQQKALQIMKGDKNIYLAGSPGTGKTYLLNEYVEWLIDNGKLPKVTASTGIAAVHINGTTIHSWAGVRSDDVTNGDIEDILENKWTMKRICETEILIIDEISMVSAKMFSIINKIAMEARGNTKPFGGIKLVVVGDFFQLPPIKGDFAFMSESWNQADFKVCYLDEQHRQSEKTFTDILTNIRSGVLTKKHKDIILSKVHDDVSGIKAIRLDTHNKRVDDINQMKLERLKGIPKTYNMISDGNEVALKALKKYCLSPERLILKDFAPVLFTKNDKDLRFVNGTQGEVVALYDNCVDILLKNGETVRVTKTKWERCEGYGRNKKVIASIEQLPLKLAWAITIHKSQGMTLDSAIIDVSRVFACGHAYVALSRLKSLDGVYFQGFLSKNFLNVNDNVKEKDKEFLLMSKNNE